MEKIHYFRPLYLALALTISLFSTASTPNRYKTSASLPDSLLTEQHIRSIYYTLPDSALSLLDEARRLPHLPQFRIDMLRGTVYERQGMYHLKERYIRRALQSDSVQHTPLRKLQVLTQLATALDRLNKYEEGIRICTEAIARTEGQRKRTAVHFGPHVSRHEARRQSVPVHVPFHRTAARHGQCARTGPTIHLLRRLVRLSGRKRAFGRSHCPLREASRRYQPHEPAARTAARIHRPAIRLPLLQTCLVLPAKRTKRKSRRNRPEIPKHRLCTIAGRTNRNRPLPAGYASVP